MSCKFENETHYGHYIEYTGWYAMCSLNNPERDGLITKWTKDWKKVTCPECRSVRSCMYMIICKCTHKEHGHEHNTGACSRCDCKKFVES